MSTRPLAAFSLAILFIASELLAQTPPPSPSPVATVSPSPAPDTRMVIDSLSQSDLSEAVSQLKANYVDPASLNEQEMNRAALQGLIDRLAPGAAIFAQAPQPPPASPFHTEILKDDIGYIRLGSLTKANIDLMDAALQNFHDKDAKSVILDLRATPAGSDYDLAAAVLGRFCPKGKPLFTVRKTNTKQERAVTSDKDPVEHGLIVALVDNDTAGAGEVIAAGLRAYANAMIVGSNTAGQAVEYSDIPLSGGKILRVAVSEVVMPGGAAIFPKGIKPDITAEMPHDVKEQVMAQSLDKGVAQFVYETERTRLNEAALVARTNPDIDAMEAAQKERAAVRAGATPRPTPLRDTVLQHAMDLITSIDIYQGKPPDTVKPAPSASPTPTP